MSNEIHRPEWEEEKIARHLDAADAVKFGISYLDDALGAIRPGELMLIGAMTGKGKTELATTLAYQASKKSRRVAFFALEAEKWEIHRRLKYRKMSQMIRRHFSETRFKLPSYREWLLQGYSDDLMALEDMAEDELAPEMTDMRIIYNTGQYTAAQFVRDFEALKDDTDMFIIDHLHYFDLTSQNESQGLKDTIHAIRNTSLKHGKPVIVLAHLRKSDRNSERVTPTLDDFHGHSDIVKVATTVLLLSSVPDEKAPSISTYPTYFHIAKSRTGSEVSKYAGAIGFDFKTNSYAEQYYLSTASFFSDPELIMDKEKIPEWAKRAILPPVNLSMVARRDFHKD